MAINNVPILVVGIGGIGCRMAAHVSDLLSEEDRNYVGIVGLDTNENDLRQLNKHGMRTIQTSDSRTVRDYASEHFFSTSWFPLDRFTAGKSMLNGAGQIRAVSRLAALAAVEQGKFEPIKEELNRICKTNTNLTVMVVGSITGGTGAGLFLQLPYYLRSIVKDINGREDIIIRGMFVGPDVTADVQPGINNKKAVYVNGYACLKELNELYLRENSNPGTAPLNVDFYRPKNQEDVEFQEDQLKDQYSRDSVGDGDDLVASRDAKILAAGNPALPYDYVYLIESTYPDGTIGDAELSNVEELVGRMVHTLMFTPLRTNALSVEDNMILNDISEHGMNRYSSTGICRLTYPVELAREYVSLSLIRDMVKDEWLALDESYKTTVATQREQQRTDRNAKVSSLAECYVRDFEEAIETGRYGLSKLYGEVFYAGNDGKPIPKYRDFISWIAERINAELEAETITKAKDACNIQAADMLKPSLALDTVSAKKNALLNYEKAAKEAVKNYASIANQLFPPVWSMLAESRESPSAQKNIYNILYNVHPITGRYLCYKLSAALRKNLQDLESRYAEVDLQINANPDEKKDYDGKKEEKQSASVALDDIRNTKFFPIIGDYIRKEKLHRIQVLFSDAVNSQRTQIDNYLELSLSINVYRLLIERIDALAENYQLFFDTIADQIQLNENHIANLEKMTLPLGQQGVYCSADAFKTIAAEFKRKHENTLQPETKTAVFEELFKVFATEFSDRGKVYTERQKQANAKKKVDRLSCIFEKAVKDTVYTSVVKNGNGIVDFNIRTALVKEYDLLVPDETMEEYIHARLEKAMNAASPMLAMDANALATTAKTVYLGLHPECASKQSSQDGTKIVSNEAATSADLLPNVSVATDNQIPTVILNDSFSPYEIICFRTRYKFTIETLTKYKEGSRAHMYYTERINAINSTPVYLGNPDDGLSVVPPHLDRYWHEEAYLRSLYEPRRIRDDAEISRAFIYALGTDFFLRTSRDTLVDYNTGDEVVGWFYNFDKPLKVKGKAVGSSYAELLHAIPYLGQFKKHLLRQKANSSLAKGKQYPSAEERFAMILENDFIRDLIHNTNEISLDQDNTAEGNILDIFLEMRGSTKTDEWVKLFDGLLYVLQDYCRELFDQKDAGEAIVPTINKSVRLILDEMLKNSASATLPDGKRDYGKEAVRKQVERIREKAFQG